MIKYANQIGIKRKDIKKDIEHPYTKISNEGLEHALKELDGFKFKLWVYLCQFTQKDVLWGYSPQALMNAAGGSRKSWDTAFNELQNAGYLKALGNKQFEFCEIPEIELKTIMNYELKDYKNIKWVSEDIIELENGEKYKVVSF